MLESAMPDLLGITFRQLQVFLRIADLGTFAAAADALGVAPPSISGHVHALELRCGALFVRFPGGRVRLTAKGELLRRRAASLLAEMQALARDLADEPAPTTIRIAAADYLYGRIKEIAADFLIGNPGADIHATVIASEAEGMEALRRESVDLFFVTRAEATPSAPDTLLGSAAAGLFAMPDLVRARALDRPGALLPILVARDADGNGMVETVLRLCGIYRIEIAARVQHVQIAKTMCLRGAGVALLYDELVGQELADGRLVRLPLPVRCLWRHCYVQPSDESGMATRFLEFARPRLIAGDSRSPSGR